MVGGNWLIPPAASLKWSVWPYNQKGWTLLLYTVARWHVVTRALAQY